MFLLFDASGTGAGERHRKTTCFIAGNMKIFKKDTIAAKTSKLQQNDWKNKGKLLCLKNSRNDVTILRSNRCVFWKVFQGTI